MFAFRDIEHFDVIEDVLSGLLECFVRPTTNAFTFEQVEEALGDRVVMAITAPAHRMFDVNRHRFSNETPERALVQNAAKVWFEPIVTNAA